MHMSSVIAHARNWYAKFERPISSLSLLGGFIFDIVTLRRIDALWDNLWIVGHLLIVAICIIAIHAIEINKGDEQNPAKAHFWLVTVLQFFFGGLLSTYLVFYFRSASLATSWPFILFLAAAFIVNESLKRHYVRLSFQISLFYLSLFSFMIYLVPILVHRIGAWVFILSGCASLFLMWLFVNVLKYFSKTNIRINQNIIWLSVFGIFGAMNIFYFTNVIPPIPLSIKDAGVYHSIQRNTQGSYIVTEERTSWKNFFIPYDDFHVVTNDPIYVYSAIYSPAALNITIIHNWQRYDEQTKRWIDQGNVSLNVLGGRENGFRTYSLRSNITPGKWHVNVETTRGQVIGIVRFTIVPVTTEAVVVEKEK
jgi:hypothetical protein